MLSLAAERGKTLELECGPDACEGDCSPGPVGGGRISHGRRRSLSRFSRGFSARNTPGSCPGPRSAMLLSGFRKSGAKSS